MCEHEHHHENSYVIPRIAAALILFACGFWFKPLFLVSYLLAGGDVLFMALRNIIKGQIFDENFLMGLATIGAICIKEYPEAVMVMILYQIGEYFQHRAVEKSRHSITKLMDIRPEEAVPVHRMLAMYTFMQDVYSKENPESKQERPSPQEVRSSVRILDFHRKESDMWELCNLAVHLMPPSRYVALRYGLADDYDRLDRLNRSGPESAYDEGVILESRLCRNAEKAAESIKDVRLPDFYLERLDGELEILGRIAASPDVVHDILQISPDFLAKYGIDKNVSATERSCQAEKAYRELDARFVRMTGRRPYADELFASIRRKRENSGIENRPRQAQRTILRNPPSKGRKMGI